MPSQDEPLTNAQRALLVASYARMQRRLYDATDAAFVAAVHFNTPAAAAEVMTDADRPVMVVLAIGEDEIRSMRARLGGEYQMLAQNSIELKPTPQPTAIPLKKRAAKKKGS